MATLIYQSRVWFNYLDIN